MSVLANNFASRENTEVHLVLYGKEREIFYHVDSRIVIHVPHFSFNDSQRVLSTIWTMLWIRKEIKKIVPNAVLTFGEFWNSLVLLSLTGLSYSVFISDRCRPDKNLGRIHNFLRIHLYKKAKGIICQTSQAKTITLKRHAHKNIAVIGNPIQEIKRENTIEKENIIVSVGRLIETKHFDRLVSVFSKLNASSWKLVIIGGDSIKQNNFIKLKEQIKELQIEDSVLLEGYQKNIDEYLLKSKIFAFMSSSEGFPNVIGEAMSAGLPVIAYDCIAGPGDMIENSRNGFLTPLFDDDFYLEKLQYLITNEEERESMGVYAKHSIKKFDANRICDNYFQFLTENQ